MRWSGGQAGPSQRCQGDPSLPLEKLFSCCLVGHIGGDATSSEALSKAFVEFMLLLG